MEFLTSFLVEKYTPQEAQWEDDATEIDDPDFDTDGTGLFDPRKQYAPEKLNRHRALHKDTTADHWNRPGLEGLVLTLPWWEECKGVAPAGKTELARAENIEGKQVDGSISFKSGSENFCIYVDSDKYDIMSGNAQFGYWKTDVTNHLNTTACFILHYPPYNTLQSKNI